MRGLASFGSVPVPPDTRQAVLVQRVTVCGATVLFVQITFVPLATMSEAGTKQNSAPCGQCAPEMVTVLMGVVVAPLAIDAPTRPSVAAIAMAGTADTRASGLPPHNGVVNLVRRLRECRRSVSPRR
jgi:hypothetical protein